MSGHKLKTTWNKWKNLSGHDRKNLIIGSLYLAKNVILIFAFRSNKSNRVLKEIRVHKKPTTECPLLSIRAVERLTNNLKPRPNCLIQALTLRDLLARGGHQAKIRLVARKTDAENFEFHAIVCLDDRPIFGNGGWENAPQLRRADETASILSL